MQNLSLFGDDIALQDMGQPRLLDDAAFRGSAIVSRFGQLFSSVIYPKRLPPKGHSKGVGSSFFRHREWWRRPLMWGRHEAELR